MKKKITMEQLKKVNPYQYSRILIALNRNKVKAETEPTAKLPKFRLEALNKIVELINLN